MRQYALVYAHHTYTDLVGFCLPELYSLLSCFHIDAALVDSLDRLDLFLPTTLYLGIQDCLWFS